MPQQIEVPGQGILEFPDGMSDSQMAQAIKKNFGHTFGVTTPTPVEEETPEWAGKYPTLYALSKTPGATAREVGDLIGLSRAGETIGKTAAYLARPEGLSPEAAKEAGLKPTKGELVGAGLQIAATAIPYGRIAKGAGMVAGKVLSPLAAELVGGATAGAVGGYTYEAGEKLAKGETPTPGATTLLGAAIPPAVSGIGKAARGTIGYLTQKEPARIINSLIGTRVKDFAYGKNPGRVIAEEGIVANTFDDFVDKISGKRMEIGQNLGDMSTALSSLGKSKGVTINLSNALSPIDQAIAKANQTPLVNKELITRLQNIKNDLIGGEPARKLSGLNFNEALEIKQLIGDITKWTGNMSDDRIANAALKQVYGNIKTELIRNAQKVKPDLALKYAKLNEKYADITSAEIAAKHKDKLMEGQSLISYRGHQGAIGAGIITTLATGGAGIPALIAMAGGAVLDKALGSPTVKTRVAAWLTKASPAQKNLIYRKLPNLAAAIDKAFG